MKPRCRRLNDDDEEEEEVSLDILHHFYTSQPVLEGMCMFV